MGRPRWPARRRESQHRHFRSCAPGSPDRHDGRLVGAPDCAPAPEQMRRAVCSARLPNVLCGNRAAHDRRRFRYSSPADPAVMTPLERALHPSSGVTESGSSTLVAPSSLPHRRSDPAEEPTMQDSLPRTAMNPVTPRRGTAGPSRDAGERRCSEASCSPPDFESRRRSTIVSCGK